MRHQASRSDAILFCAFWLSVVLLVAASSQPAEAIPGPNCENANYNVEGTQGTQQGNHIGVRAQTWFANYSNDCNRISSMGVITSVGGFVEWGWVLGYSSCNSTYYNNPRTFTWWQPNGGTPQCHVWGGASEGVWLVLEVRDSDQDTVWGAYREGSKIDDMNVNFDRGSNYVQGERDCTCDSAFAHYKNLKWLLAGQGSNWYDWSDPTLLYDNDPDFYFNEISNTEVSIKHV
jgi:hypothetical protein